MLVAGAVPSSLGGVHSVVEVGAQFVVDIAGDCMCFVQQHIVVVVVVGDGVVAVGYDMMSLLLVLLRSGGVHFGCGDDGRDDDRDDGRDDAHFGCDVVHIAGFVGTHDICGGDCQPHTVLYT